MTDRDAPLTTEPRLVPSEADERLLLVSRVLADVSPLRTVLDMLTEAIAAAFDIPVVLVSLVDVEAQHFLAQKGMPDWARNGTPISHSFCRLVTTRGEALVTNCSAEDPRVAANPAVGDLGVAAYAGQPIVVDGHVLGSLCAIDQMPRHWSSHEIRSLRHFADLVEVMIGSRLRSQTALLDERASVAAKERMQTELIDAFETRSEEHSRVEELSRRLQRALMARPAASTDIDVDELYEPGSERLLIGGDFADTLLSGADGRTLSFVIGDVTGHGPEAAALAISLRGGWKALQNVGIELPRIAEELNKQALSSGLLASVLLGTIDGGILTLLSAGHPAPIIFDGQSTQELPCDAGLLLGVHADARPWQIYMRDIGAATIVAYTDGLVEGFVNGTRERFGVDRLIQTINRYGTDPERLFRAATEQNRGPLADDVAILRIRPA